MKLVRLLVAAVLATGGLLLGTGVAAAHVTVSSPGASAGSYTVLAFRVPTESEKAGTVGLSISLPTDHPLASVRLKPIPGWTGKLTKTTLPKPVTQGDVTLTEAVTTVTFTAASGTRIGPGEFGEFELSVGPLPDVDQLSFPTVQKYDDNTTVDWTEPTPASGEEPEHPAPTLAIGEATGDDHHGAAAVTSSVSTATTGPVVSESADTPTIAHSAATNDSSARVLGVIGIALGALAVLLAALRLRRRPAGRSSSSSES